MTTNKKEREGVCDTKRQRVGVRKWDVPERECVFERERERVGVPTRYIVLPLINNI